MNQYLDISNIRLDSRGKSLDEYKLNSNLMIVVLEGDDWVGHTTSGTFYFREVDPALLDPVTETLEELTAVRFHPATGRYGVGGGGVP